MQTGTPSTESPFEQQGYRCRLEWGVRGAASAAQRGDMVVVVDILRFSTTAATALHHGISIYPCSWNDNNVTFATRVGAIPGGHRPGEDSRFSLSPLCYQRAEPGARVALASPNGAACACYAASLPALFVGAFVNAQAVGNRLQERLHTTEMNVTVLACGERWAVKSGDGDLRFALEDYIGAGAILHYIGGSMSPEAEVCAHAFATATARTNGLETMLMECGSGRELRAKGKADDVHHASRLNIYDIVPMMRDECLVSG